MILLHYVIAIFQDLPGLWGASAFIVQKALFILASFLLMYAAIPNRMQASLRWMLSLLMAVSTLYIAVLRLAPDDSRLLSLTAALLGLCPLAIMFFSTRSANYAHRWVLVLIYCALSIYLLNFQFQVGNARVSCIDFDLQVVLFASFLCSFVLVSYSLYRKTTGAFITITGFFCWATVTLTTPLSTMYLPHFRFESEVWDLPKFIVAVGMLLILLEDQIEHNKHLAQHDVLTGLPNRRLFQDRLSSALDRSRRNQSIAALLLLDLNGFKKVNDSMGHHVGDLLLARVGSILSGRVRRSDTVARTGGDEFSIILEKPASRDEAIQVGRELVQLLSEPMQLEDHAVRISASIGIAIFPDDADNMESLCVAADLRMYEDKHGVSAIQYANQAR